MDANRFALINRWRTTITCRWGAPRAAATSHGNARTYAIN